MIDLYYVDFFCHWFQMKCSDVVDPNTIGGQTTIEIILSMTVAVTMLSRLQETGHWHQSSYDNKSNTQQK